MWKLDHKRRLSTNYCFWTVVLKTLESPWYNNDIKNPVNPKGNQPWIVIRRTDAEAEAPVLWPPDVKSQLTGENPAAGEESWEAARRSNRSILKEINPEYSSEGLMLKLKLQYFGHMMRRTDSLEKTLIDAKKDWKQKEKRATEDEMVR